MIDIENATGVEPWSAALDRLVDARDRLRAATAIISRGSRVALARHDLAIALEAFVQLATAPPDRG